MILRRHSPPLPLRSTMIVLIVVGLGLGSLLSAVRPGPAAAQTGTPVVPIASPLPAGVDHLDFTVDLGDFETAAQVTFPANQAGPFPTVILIPGSGPADMDFTLVNPVTGEVTSAIFRDIAGYLSARGYAVVRYNKHYVEGPADFSSEGGLTYYQNFTFPMLLDDARLVYAAARELPQVDPARIALYGWSEGSIIAVQLALAEPAIAAVVLHGAVDSLFVDIFRYQSRDLAVDFLTDYVDRDRDGQVRIEDLIAANQAQPGTAASYPFVFSVDPAGSFTAPEPNPAVDQNDDGVLDIDAEVIPYLDAFFADFDAETAAGRSPYGPQYAAAAQFPANVAVIGELRQPILLLQGENDANVPPAAAARLDAALRAANHPDHTLIAYPGLGHSLGPAATVFDDRFAPIADEPLRDVASWLDRHLSGSLTSPVP